MRFAAEGDKLAAKPVRIHSQPSAPFPMASGIRAVQRVEVSRERAMRSPCVRAIGLAQHSGADARAIRK